MTLFELADAVEGLEPRPLASLTRLERKWLKGRLCGWCEVRLTASRCGAMCGSFSPVPETEPCDMDVKRATALQRYSPRARASGEGA